jgi:D-arabinose 1-dehydrogenase
MTSPSRPPLSSVLPPLIFGCGTFNVQYNADPHALDTKGLVAKALDHGIRAFDTSPYYGPSEELLGAALAAPYVQENYPREEYFVITKVGRIGADDFDYSADWVRKSIARSLERLQTSYLDVVYCHDVEFVSKEEVLEAIKELRRIRDEKGTVKYIGISGYPVEVLCDLAEAIRDETDEPLDVVMSYANFNVQNTTLLTQGVPRLRAAGVDVVPSASPLGMGFIRSAGLPAAANDWHPAPDGLRRAIRQAAVFCDQHGERLEVIAIRHALETWLSAGSAVGSRGDPASGVPWKKRESNREVGGGRLGVSVMGFSTHAELEKALMVWRSILDGLENGQQVADAAGRWKKAHEWSLNRKKAVALLVEGVREYLDDWLDYTWPSPSPGFVNRRKKIGAGLEVSPPTPAASPAAAVVDAPETEDLKSKEIPLR